jgi:hypothetical protein
MRLHSTKALRISLVVAAALLFSAALYLWTAGAAQAQCGSQASSCKSCHEVQQQGPVNTKGDWHIQHSLSDACANCHGGNVQAAEKDAAHQGMVAPLGDVVANCGLCHPGEETALGQRYADQLGVTLGAGNTPPSAGTPAAPAPTPSGNVAPAGGAPPAAGGVVVDYNQRYDETVLGQTPVNWGNIIVGIIVVALLAGGGSFVYWNERRLRRLAGKEPVKPKPVAATPLALDDYPLEVLALLPALKRLNPAGVHALARLLDNPDEASDLLLSLSRLDPDLVRRVRALDSDSRALLLAMAHD